MKKGYGLQLRAPPTHKRPAPPRPTSSVFAAEDDDGVEQEIARHASKNKSLRDVEEQHKKALEEDPSVFDYDGVYDEMKQKIIQPIARDRQERQSKYIGKLLEKAKEREREHDIIYERKITKERIKDDHLFADKDKFVTGAYKRKLAEQAKWQEEERLRQLREERDDVTKKSDLSDFYFNLTKNVAFGANSEVSKNPLKQDSTPSNKSSDLDDRLKSNDNQSVAKPLEGKENLNNSGDNSMVSQMHASSKSISEGTSAEGPSFAKIRASDEMVQDNQVSSENVKAADEKPSSEVEAAAQTTQNRHVLNKDDVAAAKERYLARKRAKQQQ